MDKGKGMESERRRECHFDDEGKVKKIQTMEKINEGMPSSFLK